MSNKIILVYMNYEVFKSFFIWNTSKFMEHTGIINNFQSILDLTASYKTNINIQKFLYLTFMPHERVSTINSLHIHFVCMTMGG